VSVDAQSRLLALRQRLRDTAAQLAPAAQRASAAVIDPVVALLRDVDDILSQTRTLTSSLARADGPEWDECDELTGRIVLRDLSLATASLRRVLQVTGEELERARVELPPIDDALASIDAQVADAAAYLETRHQEQQSDAPKKPRSR
jgi:hypothetical protein